MDEESIRHYETIALAEGTSKFSTMKDENVKDMEVEQISKAIEDVLSGNKKPVDILEVGCGNGYTLEKLVGRFDFGRIEGVDYSEPMVEVANSRNFPIARISRGDATNLDFEDESFDIAFTERCLINIKPFESQTKAINEISRVLRPGGVYIAVEAFEDGRKKINDAREVVGLDEIPQPFHNLFFHQKQFLDSVKDAGLSRYKSSRGAVLPENFLSTYYYGSRVLYPAIAAAQGKGLEYNNAFVEIFRHLPPVGDYSYIKMFILRKDFPKEI